VASSFDILDAIAFLVFAVLITVATVIIVSWDSYRVDLRANGHTRRPPPLMSRAGLGWQR
jgi:hypothetical protein